MVKWGNIFSPVKVLGKHFLSYEGFGPERGILDLLLTDDGDKLLIIQ